MILTISSFLSFSILTFIIGFQMIFTKLPIPSTINMNQSNQYHFIQSIKPHTNPLNNHTLLSPTCIQKSTKIDPEITFIVLLITFIMYAMKCIGQDLAIVNDYKLHSNEDVSIYQLIVMFLTDLLSNKKHIKIHSKSQPNRS
eukprot:415048_1